jgi:hypothetical protein
MGQRLPKHHEWYTIPDEMIRYQQNVIQSGSLTQSSQSLRATLPVLLSTSRRSQTPLQLSKVLSHSARAFSGAPESMCSYGGAFRMLRDLTYRIVKLRPLRRSAGDYERSWHCCAALWDTSQAAETAAQLCERLGAGFSQLWVLHNYKAFLLLQSQDSQHHNMACII